MRMRTRGIHLCNHRFLRDSANSKELHKIQDRLSRELIDLEKLEIDINKLTVISGAMSNNPDLRNLCNKLMTRASQLRIMLTPKVVERKAEERKVSYCRISFSHLPTAVKAHTLLPFLDAKSRAQLAATNSKEGEIINGVRLLDHIIFLPNRKVMSLATFPVKPTLQEFNAAMKKANSGIRLFNFKNKRKKLAAYLHETVDASQKKISFTQ